MSAISLHLRDGKLPACPYCRDPIVTGQACDECDTRYHSDCAWQLRICALLGCEGTFRPPSKSRSAQWGVRRKGAPPARPLTRLRVLIGVALLGLLALFVYPWCFCDERKPGNEDAALESLREIAASQEAFRVGHPNDCCRASSYATLEQLGGQRVLLCSANCSRDRKLIGPILARGTKAGYLFVVQPARGSSQGGAGWIATANPALPTTTGDRYFVVNHRGVVYSRTDAPFELTSDGTIPYAAREFVQ